MKITYTGPKESKTIETTGKPTLVFAPSCEVKDPTLIKFLLHPDRLGLFVEGDAEEKVEQETVAAPAESADAPRRGRPRKNK